MRVLLSRFSSALRWLVLAFSTGIACGAFAAATTVQPNCKLTNFKKDGNMGGIAGADTFCAGAFGPDWRFARSHRTVSLAYDGSVLGTTFNGQTNAPPTYGWVAEKTEPQPGNNTGTFGNCRGFTTNVTENNQNQVFLGGMIFGFNPVTYSFWDAGTGNAAVGQCTNQYPLWCCNF